MQKSTAKEEKVPSKDEVQITDHLRERRCHYDNLELLLHDVCILKCFTTTGVEMGLYNGMYANTVTIHFYRCGGRLLGWKIQDSSNGHVYTSACHNLNYT